jgi:hypothetical protein
MRQTRATLAQVNVKRNYVTPPRSGKPRQWPPDTSGIAFEKLILGDESAFVNHFGECHLFKRAALGCHSNTRERP